MLIDNYKFYCDFNPFNQIGSSNFIREINLIP